MPVSCLYKAIFFFFGCNDGQKVFEFYGRNELYKRKGTNTPDTCYKNSQLLWHYYKVMNLQVASTVNFHLYEKSHETSVKVYANQLSIINIYQK